jgi:DNA-binding transcriptional regulator LsrR (DeoR family)
VSADYLLDLENTPGTRQFRENGVLWHVVELGSQVHHPAIQNDTAVALFKQQLAEHQTLDDILRDKTFGRHGFETLRRMLKTTLLAGAIEILEVETDERMERELRAKYHSLRHVLVPKTDLPKNDRLADAVIRPELVAFLGARIATKSLEPNRNVGVSGGTTLSRFADLLPYGLPNVAGTRWCSLLSTKRLPYVASSSANDVVARILYRQLGSEGTRLPFLRYELRTRDVPDGTRVADVDDQKYALQMLSHAQDVQDVFLSLGSTEFNYRQTDYYMGYPLLGEILGQLSESERRRFVGDILLYPIDEDGNRLGSKVFQEKVDRLVFSIGIDKLKEIARHENVWALVSRPSKALVTRAALRAGYINCLVVDKSVAHALLSLEA